MGAPPSMLALAQRVGVDLSAEHDCEGSRYHTPTPLRVTREGDVWLCGTCAANLRLFALLMAATGGEMPWEVQREFGNGIRRIGKQVWGSSGG